MTTTTTEDPGAVGGWGWVTTYGNLPGGFEMLTHLRRDWDDRFTAPCPCGQVVDWDAYRSEPLCTCAPALQRTVPQAPQEED